MKNVRTFLISTIGITDWITGIQIADIKNLHTFLVSGNQFVDINNCYCWYQEIELL